ncbi:DUF3558 domain-containing protein [Nocardia lasii]|uniref:DUF3558 domain-containing protein n=1 Tax=Nocardia lasii TaxID=1616107 RepID=A0ABW1JX10_9NOCA
MRRFIPLIVGGLLAVAACSSSPQSEQNGTPSSALPSVTVMAPVSPAPAQPASNRQPVRFDPCARIDDAVPTALGFVATTRERSDYVFDDYAFIGCDFTRSETVRGQQLQVGHLTISSTNVTLEEMRARDYEDARPTTVNGKEALFHRTRAAESCYIAMPGPDATIEVRVSSAIAFTDWVACDHIDEAARTVEAALPKEGK